MEPSVKYNLEHDIIKTPWLLEKLENRVYAQNLYAAICNNKFFKTDDSFAILKDESNWSASWRSAGEIVARLRNRNEDYLDYYCSGINDVSTFSNWNEFEKAIISGFVEESVVTDEIRADLEKIGWIVKSSD